MWLEDDPLSLVFEVPCQLINHFQSLNDDILLNIATSMLSRHSFFDKLKRMVKVKDDPGLFDDYFLASDFAQARNLFGNYFGLGQTIVVEDKSGEFWRLRAVIPEGIIYSDKVCPACHGSKIDQKKLADYFITMECDSCAGSGLEAKKQFGLADELADNISLLFDIVWLLEYNCPETIDNQRPMLMFLQTGIEGYGKQFIGGYFTQALKDYLQTRIVSKTVEQLVFETSQRMYFAYNLMFYGRHEPRYQEKYDFPTEILNINDNANGERLFFSVQVPGINGCHVYSDSGLCALAPSGFIKDIFSLTCHNIDTPIQQISLIVGLAYLCGSARNK